MLALKTIIVIFFTPFILLGQLIDELPKDENGNLLFSEVVQVDSVSKNELYSRSKDFFVSVFKSAKDVVQLDDKEAGIVTGKGFSKIQEAGVELQMWYSIKIQSKNGRYKYEIFDLYFQYEAKTSPPSEVFDKSVYYKKNGEPRTAYETRKNEMLKKIKSLTESIKTTMNKKSKKDDW
ncbi:MAG: DUF4468 domain-containing protein [Bacteroidota bacterium]|jgi:hypothetical protein|nr:DUF4468 domain-containing protein [Cytophagales bacterium]MCE2956312.1 DUF4468 domain-containing protein [Flammeovirgaceae bacterium]MCZ8070569.1 DUF4468 domain-containing protein [Cytophagales bacterium]